MPELEPVYNYPDAPTSLVLWYGKDYAGSPNRRVVSTEPIFEEFIREAPEINANVTIKALTALRRAIEVQGKRDQDPRVAIHRNGITFRRQFTYRESPVMQGTRGMGPKSVLILQHLAHYAQLGYESQDQVEGLEPGVA